ncbi:hypothetical protein K5D34_11355 [Pseudomonas cichorii]|nr:hypothetical protein [Pseudomonas cichorii]MBX8510274.1 hypothetical protein [Pseudomonas cichorii]MBX8524056.1 hypothetical protein [Pseudomonas cichorii]MBX8563863.1 hypothetical protein [Pseudomonas cichorii]MBX8600830.1 hypothetical protein [Pseudomonas cichorii]
MKHDFTKLKRALQYPADGLYALEKIRGMLLEALEDWPTEKYQVADYLLPWGQPIKKSSRNTIAHLLNLINDQCIGTNGIFKPMELMNFLGA